MTAACAYAAYTAWLIARMFWFLYYSMTSAIRVDELTMMEEIRLYHEGKYGIGYLWGYYWGHRLLIPRLLMIADQRFFHFSNTPLVAVSMLAQILSVALLGWVEWRLLRDAPRWLAIIVVTATANLAFNSLQLETFAYGMEVQYTLGFLGACAAIVLFAETRKTAACLACALVCPLSIGTGVFIGPVILLVAFGLRAKAGVLVTLAILSTTFAAAYSIGYVNPGHGIGLVAAMLHPLGALWATALVLGGPITNASLAWGGACGGVGMLLVAFAVTMLLRGRLSREAAALTGFCVFLVLNALSIALTRYTLEWIAALGSNTMLPSRYFTVAFVFWGALLALLAGMRGRLSEALFVTAGAIVACLTLPLYPGPSQLDASVAWLEFHRTLDVAGAGMIMGATDPQFLFELTPDQNALDHFRPYMQQNRLSYFADERASWPGRDLKSVFGEPIGGCRGAIDTRSPAGATIRLQGFIDGPGVRFPLEREIVLADAEGKIDGLGNTLAISEKRGGQDFVAYADTAAAAAFLITPDHKACRFAP
jgi:hypothetical protein